MIFQETLEEIYSNRDVIIRGRVKPIPIDRSYIENYQNPGTYWIKRVEDIYNDFTEDQIVEEMEHLLEEKAKWIVYKWKKPLSRYMNYIQ